jgi:hypothetical protein
MPDPLLIATEFGLAFARAKVMAERIAASLTRDGELVFLECAGPAGQPAKLARLDCTGYPMRAPDVRFLDPSVRDRQSAEPSADRSHWPASPAPMQRGSEFHVCLAGTQSYLLWHPDAGGAIDLSTLVVMLVRSCRGEPAQVIPAGRR